MTKFYSDKLLTEMGGGSKAYDGGKQKLEVVIREYDQAVFDLTAKVVASNISPRLFDTPRL
jgi:hypothetical protein